MSLRRTWRRRRRWPWRLGRARTAAVACCIRWTCGSGRHDEQSMLPSHAFAGEVTAGKAVVVVVAEAGHGAYLLQCYNLLKNVPSPGGGWGSYVQDPADRDCPRPASVTAVMCQAEQRRSLLQVLLAVSRGERQPRAQPCSCHALSGLVYGDSGFQNMKSNFSMYLSSVRPVLLFIRHLRPCRHLT